MNRIYYTKSRNQVILERVIWLASVFFLSGVLVGMCLSGVLHKCEVTPIETTAEETPIQENAVEVVAEIADASENNLIYLGNFKATAYCPCYECSEGYGNSTATGAVATQGRTIAVDPKVIPYGTTVIVDGHEYIAEDCGGSIKENRIDIFYDCHTKALEFGVQYKDVYVRG